MNGVSGQGRSSSEMYMPNCNASTGIWFLCMAGSPIYRAGPGDDLAPQNMTADTPEVVRYYALDAVLLKIARDFLREKQDHGLFERRPSARRPRPIRWISAS